MQRTAHIDVAGGEQPRQGEKFVIALQENSEMLGQLDDGRTFRFVSPSDVERDYQQENRILTVVGVDLGSPYDDDPRLVGSLHYTD
jgi:hypothetical protein